MTLSLLTIFGAGLLTFASPCVLPLMPIYLALITDSALERARAARTLLVAACFTLGFGAVFVALGALASSVGAWLNAYHRPVGLLSAALMILFGLRGLGVLRIAAFDRDARVGLQRVRSVSGPVGAFVFGAAFGLGWSPCIGPVLASVLTYTATHSDTPWHGAGYLAVYALGLALPMLALAAVAGRAAQIIRSARNLLPVLEKATGAALLGIGVWTLVPLAQPEEVVDPTPIAAVDASTPAPSRPGGECANQQQGHACALPQLEASAEPGDLAEVVNLHDDNHRVLEFSARDCPVCRRMRPLLDELAAACSELDGWIVRVDVSTARGRALALQHAVRGTPTYVLIDRDGVEHGRLIGENSREDIAAAIERAFGVSCWG